MTVQESKAIVLRLFDEVWNEGRLATIEEVIAPAFEGHDPFAPKGLQGHEGFKQYVTQFRTAFPDVHFTIEAQIGEDDLVVTRWSAQGTFTGPFLDLKPTGKTGMVTGVTISRLADGVIREAWIQRDDLSMLRQLGAVPETTAALV